MTHRSDTLSLRHELEALAIDFWHEVDVEGGRDAASYYTEDAVFETSVGAYQGRDAIAAFYQRRRARAEPRVSLHVVNNFRIQPQAADRVHCHYIMSLFAGDGAAPLPSRPAIMLALVEEVVLRQADGGWRYQSRRIRAQFRDDTPTTG